MSCFRPIIQSGTVRPKGAVSLLGRNDLWFLYLESLERGDRSRLCTAEDLSDACLAPFVNPRAPLCGLDLSVPRIMGILNVTPDSFSDGGRHNSTPAAIESALRMKAQGAALIDVGGESTRPGAAFVDPLEEIERTAPVIAALRERCDIPISIDTRKMPVARAALDAGASVVNDVAGFTFDKDLAPLCAQRNVPVCVMHAQGDPGTMQDNPQYDDVVLDVFDFLKSRISYLETLGMSREQIVVDPGIGFGKSLDHNLELLRNISVFHGLGCPVLLGASRKRFIGTIGEEPRADARAPGSVAVGLAALAQGVQLLRVHDVSETRQAMRLWNAVQ